MRYLLNLFFPKVILYIPNKIKNVQAVGLLTVNLYTQIHTRTYKSGMCNLIKRILKLLLNIIFDIYYTV